MVGEQLFIRAVRDGHDVDVLKFGACFAPIAMGKNTMAANFAPRFNFATWRHGPMEECVEAGHTNSASRWFDVFEKS